MELFSSLTRHWTRYNETVVEFNSTFDMVVYNGIVVEFNSILELLQKICRV